MYIIATISLPRAVVNVYYHTANVDDNTSLGQIKIATNDTQVNTLQIWLCCRRSGAVNTIPTKTCSKTKLATKTRNTNVENCIYFS